MHQLKFAIIGCGRIARRHAEHIQTYGVLAAVCDVVEEKAASFAQEYHARAYTSLNDLIREEKELDIIVICTPNGWHAQHSIAALKAGFHVLVEKPMALSVADCREMMQAAENAGRKLFVVKQNRFNPPVMALKEAIDAGRLGKIFSVQLNCFWNRPAAYYADSWRGTKEWDGGTLFTQFSHFIDLLYWMIGDVENVFAVMGNFAHQDVIEFEDTGAVILEFENGAIGTINYTVNSYQENMEGSLTVFGENGTVKIGGQYLNEMEYQRIKNFQFKELPKSNAANQYGTYTGSMSNHDKVYEQVINVLQNESLPARLYRSGGRSDGAETNTFDAMKTVEIIQKIYNAAIQSK